MMDKEDGGCHLLAKSLLSFWPGELKKYIKPFMKIYF